MTVLGVLKIVAAVGTILTGLVSLVQPLSIKSFTGLELSGPRGITEVRSILGGLFIALGVVPLVFGDPVTYQMLGIAYLGIGLVRFVSMFVDRSVERSNIISLVVEVLFGVILVV